ncbi:hypothetical protein IGI04_022866 [Brassica rapa subsp. trilocularis]|uniref:Uncharacterized protein n=1 Tax=Brassica rapa subsp. trilocularis TaxID=1813537 RepID=A0ABQ7M289_BRACM|nr:hypothetical protein IGI04_022866 [Brassica rapa subsp. trilocularis]
MFIHVYGVSVTSRILNRIIGTAMDRGNVLASHKTSRQAFHGRIRKLRTSDTTRSAPLAGLLAHSAEAAGDQLISAGRSVRVSVRWSGSGPMAGHGRSGHEVMDRWGLGQGRGLSTEELGKALGLCPTQTHAVLAKGRMRPRGNLRSSMGDREQEKSMENPDLVQKVRGGLGPHQSERTVLVIAPRLWTVH